MPKVKIESEIKPDLLYYNWEISRKFRITSQAVTEKHEYNIQKLLNAWNQPLNADYHTADHQLNLMGNLPQNTLFVSKLSVYLKGQEEHAETFIGIYTLAELQSGKIHDGENGFEVPCFKSSTGSTEKQDNHTVVCEIPQQEKRAFFCTSILTEEAYKKGVRSYADPFDKEIIEQEILSRIDKEKQKKALFPYPYQGPASLCGPAVFFYALLKDRPDIYEAAAWTLWKHGKVKIGELKIKAGQKCRNVTHLRNDNDIISGLDWLTLASLRDSSNIIANYDQIEDRGAGITIPSDLISWFEKIGGEKVVDNTILLPFNKGISELVDLNNMYVNNCHVMFLVSSNIIDGLEGSNNKDHWISLAEAIKIDGNLITKVSNTNKSINFNIFTWGVIREFKNKFTLNTFFKKFYGGIAVKAIK